MDKQELPPVNIELLVGEVIEQAVACGCCVIVRDGVERIQKYVMMYYADTLEKCRDAKEVEEALKAAGVGLEELYTFLTFDREYKILPIEGE